MSLKRDNSRSAGSADLRALLPAVRSARLRRAFTLIELLVVIAIIGIVAAISVPAFKNMKQADASAAGTRQLLDAIARARQFAISQRTTVYMVFLPPGFWDDSYYLNKSLYDPLALTFSDRDRSAVTNLLDKQLVGYNFVAMRAVGDQPGQNRPRYLDEWRALPEGTYIEPGMKFGNRAVTNLVGTVAVRGFEVTKDIPFPTADTLPIGNGYIWLPYLAFNYQGQLVGDLSSDGSYEAVALARGKVAVARTPGTKVARFASPTVQPFPPGSTNYSSSLIVIDRLTGRASVDSL